MKTNTQVVVIGGGIGGCSTIYHLTQEGITDCMLLERDELTSGTTWHSAAQVTNFGGTQTMIGLKSHSIKLYKELADDPDYPINYHHATGGIRLAGTQDHLDGYHHFVSLAKGMGVDFEVIDAAEAQKRHPDYHRQFAGRSMGPAGRRYRPGTAVSGTCTSRPQRWRRNCAQMSRQ